MEYQDFEIEQKEIIQLVSQMQEKLKGKGKRWNRFRGDVTTRIVAHYLNKHLPNNVKLALFAWVEDYPTEYDILVIDKDAGYISFTNAYPRSKVRVIIEVKAAGLFYRLDDMEKKLTEISNIAKDIGKPFLYLSLWEQENRYNKTLNV